MALACNRTEEERHGWEPVASCVQGNSGQTGPAETDIVGSQFHSRFAERLLQQIMNA